MAAAVYILGFLVTLCCGILLLRAYGASRMRLLLWSGICFVGLAISNFLVFVDLVILPEVDLYLLRLVTAAIAMVILLYGLIWEGQQR
jgi:lipopolysaccharide export LptBFGC system permease protein LptF